MGVQRAHVVFPEDLAAQIDKIAGKRGRNAYIVETMRAEVKRRNLLAFLEDPTPAWKDKDHPELAKLGTEAYVRKMRSGKSERQKKVESKLANSK